MMTPTTFPCPECGRQILTSARRCRFCQREVDQALRTVPPAPASPAVAPPSEPALPTGRRQSSLTVLAVIVVLIGVALSFQGRPKTPAPTSAIAPAADGALTANAAPAAGVPPSREKDELDFLNPVTVAHQFDGGNNAFVFNAPRGLLGRMRVSEGTYPEAAVFEWPVAGEGASIRLILLYSGWGDEKFDSAGLASEADFLSRFLGGDQPMYQTRTKTGRFVASGFNRDGRIYYRQGDYGEFFSMQGRESGEPTWLWSRSWIIEFTYPEARRDQFDRIIPMVTRSLTVNEFW